MAETRSSSAVMVAVRLSWRDVKRAPQRGIGLLALLVDIARRLAKAGDQRRDLLRFFRHDRQGDVFVRLRSMVFHCNPPVLPRVDATNFPGSYCHPLKPVDVNRIKLDSIFDRRVPRAEG